MVCQADPRGQLLHQIADFFLTFEEGHEVGTRIVDVLPAIACADLFPFGGLVHLRDRFLVGIELVLRQTRRGEEARQLTK